MAAAYMKGCRRPHLERVLSESWPIDRVDEGVEHQGEHDRQAHRRGRQAHHLGVEERPGSRRSRCPSPRRPPSRSRRRTGSGGRGGGRRGRSRCWRSSAARFRRMGQIGASSRGVDGPASARAAASRRRRDVALMGRPVDPVEQQHHHRAAVEEIDAGHVEDRQVAHDARGRPCPAWRGPESRTKVISAPAMKAPEAHGELRHQAVGGEQHALGPRAGLDRWSSTTSATIEVTITRPIRPRAAVTTHVGEQQRESRASRSAGMRPSSRPPIGSSRGEHRDGEERRSSPASCRTAWRMAGARNDADDRGQQAAERQRPDRLRLQAPQVQVEVVVRAPR